MLNDKICRVLLDEMHILLIFTRKRFVKSENMAKKEKTRMRTLKSKNKSEDLFQFLPIYYYQLNR